ncbi:MULTISPECIES: helix-turn-helix domain-containing protein [unclassified Amycolatopsis]|uniref:helix-turn-helix domain-containing protein n=1 Tax=unclassified Amycolatopsis TaxID=2618356 RepID=UPI0028767412|nr:MULTISPECIES: helix-turn-helix domain-containing protein [unclassified Amycolatopsis]MDS0132065.1 helix-turn-helix domain-containing protein [Amycolatopsis sp. 505]MDS0141197.1 helix-turn-helix domain-containing protein [Amycolatopsis sp. CM201R]
MTGPPVETNFGPMLGGDGRPGQLWAMLPRELAAVFRPRLLDVADEVLREIQRTIPDYARPLDGTFGKALRAGVQAAILQFIDRIAASGPLPEERRKVFVGLGVHELAQGRNLDVLQAAYRVGARVTWRRMAEVGTRAGVPSATLCLLAEAIFAYIDELSALSIEGHAAAQARAAGALERRRRRLLDLLLADPPSPSRTVQEAATAAEWPLPHRLVAVALDGPADVTGLAALEDFEDGTPRLLLPAPADRRALAAALAGHRAAVGPPVPPRQAGRSLATAQEALRLVAAEVLPDEPLTWCEDHLATLWLRKEPFLVTEVSRRRLAPLTALTPKQYNRLAGTLLAWLETCGNVREVADRLAIHPQTVRARAQELETLFAESLRTPDDRFEMILALRATLP